MSYTIYESDTFVDTDGLDVRFHGADNALGGSNTDAWQDQIGFGNTIQSNRMASPVSAGTYVYALNTTSTDGRVTAKVYGVANGVGVVIRLDPATGHFYGYIGGATNSRLFYFDGSTFNVIATGGPALTDGDTMAIVANGTTIYGYLNGTLALTATGQADIASGKPGTYLGGGSSAVDNFVYETGTAPVVTATNLGITTAPVGNQSGVAYTTEPVIAVRDAGLSTVTSDTSTVTAAITVLTGSVTLSGTTTKAAVAGVADFAGTGLKVTGTGSYTMTFSDGALTTATTGTLWVGPAAVHITSQATTAYTQRAHGNVVVAVRDGGGTTVTNATNSITIALTVITGAAVLTSGTTTRSASSGVATFNDLLVTCTDGATWTYAVSASGLTGDTSSPLTGTVRSLDVTDVNT